MVATSAHFSDPRYRASPGEGFDGVVRVSFGGFYATGALLYDGRAVLTAAHLFEGRTGPTSVSFETTTGSRTISGSEVLRHPGYDLDGNHDLAIVWLEESAPRTADRYEIYRQTDELGQTFEFSGYGITGTGNTGASSSNTSSPIRLTASNQFDTVPETLVKFAGSVMAWTPLAGSQLIADFDNGQSSRDALAILARRPDLGVGLDEGLIARGDSGGPAFIDGRVAGIASYVASLSQGGNDPDIDSATNSSFGEIAAWQRMSYYQQWIDQAIRAKYPNAPTSPADVVTRVTEGDSGTSLAYFLLTFTGVRSDPQQILSVDFATRDGTAVAGSDYIAAQGTLRLYPDEEQAVIAVEIIGDTVAEQNELFYLDVSNPVGGSFGDGVPQLTAVRTILNDDGLFA